MIEDFLVLKNEFKRIKRMGLIEPLRKGSTGLGYTFETLLNKKEDQECLPDFRGIELKTKLGYSKSPLTLFTFAPKRFKETATNYIFEKYSYPKYNDKNTLEFKRDVYSKKLIKRFNYEFKLSVDYFDQQIVMKSYYNGKFVEDVCYWDFKTLEKKLKVKLSKLAIIYAYPYKKDNKLYYKYLKMNTYKLRGFFEFLQLIQQDKIFVKIGLQNKIEKDGNVIIDNHGVAFKIHNEFIEELFIKLNY